MVGVFNPIVFLDVADHLHLSPICGKEEACYRTAIGRIYYTAYLLVVTKLKNAGKSYNIETSQGSGVHEKLISYLKTSGNKIEFALGNSLHSLKELRVRADYKPQDSLEKPDVTNALSIFGQIKLQLNTLQWYSL